MQNPEAFFLSLENNEQRIAEILHHEIISNPGVSVKIRFNLPFYDYHKWLCYLSPQITGGIEFCLVQGVKIDPDGIYLQAKKRTQVAGITFQKPEEIDAALIRALVMEAINYEILNSQAKKKQPKKLKHEQ